MWRFFRRCSRFGLRTLLIVTAICAVYLGWRTNRSRSYRAALAELESTDSCLVYVEFHDPPKWSPTFARPLLGHDRASLVRRVTFQGANTERHVQALAKLKQLEVVSFSYGDVSDDMLVHLQGLTNLRTLIFCEVPVTGAGFRHLRGMKRLRRLVLLELPLDDENLAHLESLDQLDEIVCNTLTDAAVPHLVKLRSLEKLRIGDRSRVTQQGYEALRRALPNCTIVWQPAEPPIMPAAGPTP